MVHDILKDTNMEIKLCGKCTTTQFTNIDTLPRLRRTFIFLEHPLAETKSQEYVTARGCPKKMKVLRIRVNVSIFELHVRSLPSRHIQRHKQGDNVMWLMYHFTVTDKQIMVHGDNSMVSMKY